MQTKTWGDNLRRNQAPQHVFLQQMLLLQLLFQTILCIAWFLKGVNRGVLFHLLKGENSSRSFLWGLLLSQAAELTSVFAIACMIILFQTEAIWAYLCSTAWENRGIAGHMHLRPGLNTVGCLTSPHVGCLVSHFLGRELEKHKEYIYQHALCVLKLRLYYCQKDC